MIHTVMFSVFWNQIVIQCHDESVFEKFVCACERVCIACAQACMQASAHTHTHGYAPPYVHFFHAWCAHRVLQGDTIVNMDNIPVETDAAQVADLGVFIIT